MSEHILQLLPILEILALEFHAMYALTSGVLRRLTRRVPETAEGEGKGRAVGWAPKLKLLTVLIHSELDDVAL